MYTVGIIVGTVLIFEPTWQNCDSIFERLFSWADSLKAVSIGSKKNQ
jgi:hypothetical protein